MKIINDLKVSAIREEALAAGHLNEVKNHFTEAQKMRELAEEIQNEKSENE